MDIITAKDLIAFITLLIPLALAYYKLFKARDPSIKTSDETKKYLEQNKKDKFIKEHLEQIAFHELCGVYTGKAQREILKDTYTNIDYLPNFTIKFAENRLKMNEKSGKFYFQENKLEDYLTYAATIAVLFFFVLNIISAIMNVTNITLWLCLLVTGPLAAIYTYFCYNTLLESLTVKRILACNFESKFLDPRIGSGLDSPIQLSPQYIPETR